MPRVSNLRSAAATVTVEDGTEPAITEADDATQHPEAAGHSGDGTCRSDAPTVV